MKASTARPQLQLQLPRPGVPSPAPWPHHPDQDFGSSAPAPLPGLLLFSEFLFFSACIRPTHPLRPSIDPVLNQDPGKKLMMMHQKG